MFGDFFCVFLTQVNKHPWVHFDTFFFFGILSILHMGVCEIIYMYMYV